MSEYYIRGGKRLAGSIRVGGGKNAVLPILAAAVLNEGESIIHNCPIIQDTLLSVDILKSLGCRASFEGNTLIINSAGVNNYEVPAKLAGEMRSSILFMGSLLGRFGKAAINYPGGCRR
jgi:UDP-N-acetylglucosamine 1-carboxyvinyltransferase